MDEASRKIHIIASFPPEQVSPTCLCGTRRGSPHDEHCPFPCFAGDEGMINSWENQREYIVEQKQLLERMMANPCVLCGVFTRDKHLSALQLQKIARKEAWERRNPDSTARVTRETRTPPVEL